MVSARVRRWIMLRGRRRRFTKALFFLPCVSGCLGLSRELAPEHARIPTMPAAFDVSAATTLGPAAPRPEVAEIPPTTQRFQDRLQVPPDLPGADAPPIRTYPRDANPAQREAIVRSQVPDLGPIGPEVHPVLPPSGRPWTLAELQALALQNSPVIPRAVADVEAARGAVIQAGLHPNPTFGYEADQVQPGPVRDKNNAGQQGGYLNQLIKTAGKLQLSRLVALMDQYNAELALRRAQTDLAAQVRGGYFSVLVAEETVSVSRALARLTEEVFRVQQDQTAAGQAAAYEPIQLYVQAVQARNALIQAHNRYLSAWKQLAAALGDPALPPTVLAGRANAAVPQFEYAAAMARVTTAHTDVLTGENTIVRGRYALRLAEVNRIPDLQTNTVLQHDNAAGNNQFNLQVGFALPLFDRNQGNIYQARAQLERAVHDLQATRNDLARQLAAAFERYESNRLLVANQRDRIVPGLVRVYRAIYARYQQEPDKVSFNDVAVAQQNLAAALVSYMSAQSDQWTAVVDITNLLQTDDLYGVGRGECASLPPISEQIELPPTVEPLLPRPAPLARPSP
jgi:cobalt-zinc-cadmium efflux system outer membrane protein